MSVTQVTHCEEIAAYIEAALVPPKPALTHAYENTTKHSIPMVAVSSAQGKFLSLLTAASRAKNVLKLGTLGGYSTIWFAEALKKSGHGGKVTSIEVDQVRHDVALQNLEAASI